MAILAFGRWFVQGGVGFDGYYRESKQPKYEMYMDFIYHQRFIILQSTENELIFVDEVELTKSKTYQELAHFSEY